MGLGSVSLTQPSLSCQGHSIGLQNKSGELWQDQPEAKGLERLQGHNKNQERIT